jgi:hypothetical protein
MNKHAALCLFLAACTQAAEPPAPCEGDSYFHDGDGDGFGDADIASCEPQAGFVARSGDCDDAVATVHPMAAEVCDQIDNNCDGATDDADPAVDVSGGTLFSRDADGDGFGDRDQPARRACAAPAGHVSNATDCDDGAAAVNPSASEVCDLIDNDCDAIIDMADPSIDLATATSYFRDADGDLFGAGPVELACTQPSGFVPADGDCNDADATSKPGGTELCDGRDNNCDGGVDGTPAAPNQCAALVGTYGGSYQHLAEEKLGTTVINSMSCSGTGSGALVLNRTKALQGTFNCVYNGGLTLFDQTQTVTLRADVALNGAVTGTVEHTYDTFGPLKRTYNVTGTQTATALTLNGTGSFFPHPMSAVPWQVTFSFAANK